MVNAQQVEETRIKRNNREFKREKFYQGSASNGRLGIQDKPRFKKRVSNQFPSDFHKASKDRVSNTRPKLQRVGIRPSRNLLVPSAVKSIWVNV